jgi:predicted metal-dependent HD superfamily phosphohydrolase
MTMQRHAMHANWLAAWSALDCSASNDLFEALLVRYAEPQRRYHTLQHLGECLGWFEHERDAAERPAEVALALWFHDAIYDVHAHDNEARSAAWAAESLRAAGVADAVARRVHSLVMATRHDAVPQGRDAELLIDIDLSILGAARERFDEYEQQVNDEYSFVPLEIRGLKRREILQRFLDRKSIYATPRMHAALEVGARENLRRSIDAPRTTPPPGHAPQL